jgi:hypothetical protein
MPKIYRRRGGRVLGWNPWNHDAEVGDFMIDSSGRLWRLGQSRGRNKRDAGDLTPIQIKPPFLDARAYHDKRDDAIYWTD